VLFTLTPFNRSRFRAGSGISTSSLAFWGSASGVPKGADILSKRQSVSSSTSRTVFIVLAAISFSHLLNDLMQSLLPAIYPMLKTRFNLDYWQIGLITLTNQLTASLLQPVVGFYTDKRPQPYSLAAGMAVTLLGLLLLAFANGLSSLLLAAGLVGVGSSVFHPESSRIARVASGGRFGLAQSLFQTGGNAGSSLGPLLAAFIVVPRGQSSIAWFSVAAIMGIALLWRVGAWYARTSLAGSAAVGITHSTSTLPTRLVRRWIIVLLLLVFSKFIYLTSLTNYYTFFLIHRFHVSVQSAQLHLFAFLAAVAAGTFAGGPLGDRFGRKYVIWGSIFGVLPFTLALPYVNLFWTTVLSIVIGLILASAFSAILVYAQELLPGRVGLVSGLFFGLAFGTGGLGAAMLGKIADLTSLDLVYHVCAWLPAIGLLTAWLPDPRPAVRRAG
jgi:FSR family fosmidomycin resistance protein-like MFS transporter